MAALTLYSPHSLLANGNAGRGARMQFEAFPLGVIIVRFSCGPLHSCASSRQRCSNRLLGLLGPTVAQDGRAPGRNEAPVLNSHLPPLWLSFSSYFGSSSSSSVPAMATMEIDTLW